MNARWMSVDEIAAYLGVSSDTICAWPGEQRIPGHKLGRLWKFKSEGVDGWVRSGGAAVEARGLQEAG